MGLGEREGELSPFRGKWESEKEEPPSPDLEGDASPTSFAPNPWFREWGQSGPLKVVQEREGRVPAPWVIPALLDSRKDQENIVFLPLASVIHSFSHGKYGEGTAFGVRRKGRSGSSTAASARCPTFVPSSTDRGNNSSYFIVLL